MTEENLNMSMRKFLKKLGVTGQQEIESSIRAAKATGDLTGQSVKVTATIRIEETGLEHTIDGTISLNDEDSTTS